MPQALILLSLMASTSVIAPVDVSAIYVLIIGSIIAGFTQMLVLFVTTETDKEAPSTRRFWANVGIGAIAGFSVGVWFLGLQTGTVHSHTVVMYQALAGFIGYDALLLLTDAVQSLLKLRPGGRRDND